MTTYGILVVAPDWQDQTSAPLDKATVLHDHAAFVSGTQALIDVKEPVDAIVAEAIFVGEVREVDTAPPGARPAPPVAETAAHTERGLNVTSTPDNPPATPETQPGYGINYRVPLEVTRPRPLTTPIPLSQMQTILGARFAITDNEWISLSEADYHALVEVWEGGQ